MLAHASDMVGQIIHISCCGKIWRVQILGFHVEFSDENYVKTNDCETTGEYTKVDKMRLKDEISSLILVSL